MNKFWHFMAMMLHYRRLLAVALVAALFDAACKVAGVGSLTIVINLFFREKASLGTLLAEKAESVKGWVDLSPWLAYVPESDWSGLALVLGFIVFLTVLGSLARFTHEALTYTVALRSITRLRKRVFTRLVHLPMSAVTTGSSAELISRVVRDCATLGRGFTALTGRTVSGVLGGLAMVGFALYLDWKLTMTFMVAVPPIIYMIRKFGKRIRKTSKKALKAQGVMLGALTQTMHALRVVKVQHAEGYERRRFNNINRGLLEHQMRSRTARAMSAPVVETLSLIGLVVVILIAAWTVFPEGGDRIAPVEVLLALVVGGASFRQLAGLNNSLQEAAAAAENIDQVLHMPVEATPRAAEQRVLAVLPRHCKTVEFEGVGFTYPGVTRPTLTDIRFSVPHGATCAVVGANGSGKSTLLGLLPRLYEPTAGRVLVDGRDISRHTLRSLRRQIAMVTQETVLFEGTVAENILYGNRYVPMERVMDAARRAHAHDFIAALPEGYETQAGERGQRLSGGQRQRIAIARAILRDPAILILDEATSQIDADSEAQIAQAISEFVTGRTTFVIAHRLSTVVHADMIVVMSEGQIASIGRHSDLLKTSDVYRILCRTQLHGLES